jgi:hypothetical protein
VPEPSQIGGQARVEVSENFYSGALGRIFRIMVGLAIVFTGTAWLRFGWRMAIGFAVGCAVAYLNFYWLKRVVGAMAGRITHTGRGESGRGIVLRFLLRYFLAGVVAYAILRASPASLYGLLTGLFLPVAAIACEAGYELYVTLARGL